MNELSDERSIEMNFAINIPMREEYTDLLNSFLRTYHTSSVSVVLYRSVMYSSVKSIPLRKKNELIVKNSKINLKLIG